MEKKDFEQLSGRRKFLEVAGWGLASLSLAPGTALAKSTVMPQASESRIWLPFSDKKVRVGLVGYGASKFSADFGFQNHPNVEVVAVSDLFADRCTELAKVTGCNKTYPSLEALVKDDNIEAVFVATDAPNHARHCIEVLNHGKHVAVAVPVTYGSIEEGEKLLQVVRKNRGLKFMMFETSCFRADLYAMRKLYEAGALGTIVYSEAEYYHGVSLTGRPGDEGVASYKNWRRGGPPQWYGTHNNAYHIGVTGGTFTEVTCFGVRNDREMYKPGNNIYNNPFSTEIAMFLTSEGGLSRQARSGDSPGKPIEAGRVRGTKGTFHGQYEGIEKNLPSLDRPPLPKGVPVGGHGGSHGNLTHEFILSILENREPLIDIITSLNMTVPGIVAHLSALKNGERIKIPQYKN
jgi:predicted dehydrogenase